MTTLSAVVQKIRFYWHLLSKTFQKIFLYLQWFNKTYIHTFPTLDTIAAACECSRRTVSRSLQFFVEQEWLSVQKRPYQSNLYYIHPQLLEFDCFDNDNFKKVNVPQRVQQNVPQNVPVLESSNLLKEGTSTEVPDIISEEAAKPKIHPCIKYLSLTDEEKQRLTANFAEFHLANAIDDGKFYEAKGNKVKTLMGFLWAQATKSKKRLQKA